MTLFVVTGASIGVILGTRFTVLAVIPAIACVLAIAVTRAAIGGEISAISLAPMAALLVSLQLGYLGGALLSFSREGRNTAHDGAPSERRPPRVGAARFP